MITTKNKHCPILYALCLLTFSIIHQPSTIAGVRYVSHTGTSTPPYTTWETAADSIQKAINICNPGDTVIVANGVYNENVLINKTVNLWGSSADSTIVIGPAHPEYYVIRFDYNNSSIKNFQIRSPGNQNWGLYISWSNIKAENCKIKNVFTAIRVSNSSPIIENFIITNFIVRAINESPILDTCKATYKNNLIISNGGETPVDFLFSYPTFINNILIEEGDALVGIHGEELMGGIIKNNLISGFDWDGIALYGIYQDTAHVISNHLINNAGDPSFAGGSIITSNGNRTQIRNNILANSWIGIRGINGYAFADYNLFWNVANLNVGYAILGDSNIVADPMFVNDTIPTSDLNFDFHLQAFSPAIDKGDPSIQDVDGSRSDIGMFGGPDGEKYLQRPCT